VNPEPVRCAVLLSGSGRTLENFVQRIGAGDLPLEIVAVVSSRKNVRGVQVARDNHLPVEVFPRRQFDGVVAHNEAINAWLTPHRPEMIVLAGYLCFYMEPEGFAGPVVNIHPALLPKYGGKGYYGDKVHQAVLAAGEKQSGCTVHLVDGKYDTGRILDQQIVPVNPDDDVSSLASRVFSAECELYPRVLSQLAREIRQA
jgi:phosphoribosylglycinamide formyltransferase 1